MKFEGEFLCLSSREEEKKNQEDEEKKKEEKTNSKHFTEMKNSIKKGLENEKVSAYDTIGNKLKRGAEKY